MPFESEAQRRFMFAKHPKIAREFAEATPKGADLPEHVKKMAEGGDVESKDKTNTPAMPDIESNPEAFNKEMDKDNVQHDSDAVRSYLSSKFHKLLHSSDEIAQQPSKMAEGGPVMRSSLEHPTPNAMMARAMADGGYAEGGYPHVTFLENETPEKVQETVHLEPKRPMPVTSTETGEKENPPHMAEGGTTIPSHEEKLAAIYKAMGIKKYAEGGPVLSSTDNSTTTSLPPTTDPTYWDQIKAALAKVAAPVTAPMNALRGATEAITPSINAVAPGVVYGVNKLTGSNIPIPSAPKADTIEPSTSPALPVPPATMVPPPIPPAATTSAVAPATPDLKNLFNQDTSKLTTGVNAEDRQALANKLTGQQQNTASIVAEALSGLGDALAAKGGREQHSLKDIFSLQKQQRDEALANFDKARQDRLEKLDLQTKMGANAVQQLAAKDAYGVDEHLNKMLGAPPGTAHKDLPLYMQMMSAQIANREKDADLFFRSRKQAADEIDTAEKGAGVFHIKIDPQQRQAAVERLGSKYQSQAKGLYYTATNPQTGHKIETYDGGLSWRDAGAQ